MEQPRDIQGLIAAFGDLHDLDRTIAELIGRGPTVIQAVREYLIHGRPSTTYQPRQAAVQVLSALGAKDALIEYLRQENRIADPAVRYAEEAVESTAARELSAWRDADVFALLLEIARTRNVPGVIDALGEWRDPEAIPYFDRALEDDICREPAANALRKLGVRARGPLVLSALTPLPDEELETPSSLARRRCALGLLAEIGIAAGDWADLRVLLDQSDPEIVALAAQLGRSYANVSEAARIARRLIDVLPRVPWYLQDEVAACLAQLPGAADIVDLAIAGHESVATAARVTDSTLQTLRRARKAIP